MAATRSQTLLKEVMMNETEEVLGSRLDNLKETIDDHNAKIGERIHALLLLLRSGKREEENLHVHAYSASSQLPESPDFNRPEPKPNYVIKATSDVTEASSPLPNHTIKFHQRISLKEIEERRLKGLCLFCEESETPYHYLRHKKSGILMIDSDEDRFLIDKELVETDVGVSSEMLRNGKDNPPQAATGFELDVGGTQSLNQDRLKFCAENKGCLGCSQALVLVKGITECSSSAKELMKEEPDFVNVNEVKMEKQIVDREMSPSITVLETGTKGMIGSHATTAFVFKQTAISYYQCSEHNLFSTMLLRLQSKKKQRKGHKSWMFKYKFDEEDQGILQSRTEYSFSIKEISTFISQAEALFSESKVRTEKQIPNLQFLKKINVSHYRWTQEEPAVILFLIRRHLYLNLDCEAPELAGRKRNHGLLFRLHSKQKRKKCPKCWMFKFRRKKKIDQRLGYDVIDTWKTKKTWTKWRVRKHDNLSWKEDASDKIRSRSSRCIVEVDIKEDDQKQQGDLGHSSLIIAVANQSHLWSTSYHVWHRWKARCVFVEMISTMRAWLFGEEGFDIGK